MLKIQKKSWSSCNQKASCKSRMKNTIQRRSGHKSIPNEKGKNRSSSKKCGNSLSTIGLGRLRLSDRVAEVNHSLAPTKHKTKKKKHLPNVMVKPSLQLWERNLYQQATLNRRTRRHQQEAWDHQYRTSKEKNQVLNQGIPELDLQRKCSQRLNTMTINVRVQLLLRLKARRWASKAKEACASIMLMHWLRVMKCQRHKNTL